MKISIKSKTRTNQEKPHVHSRSFNLFLIHEQNSICTIAIAKRKKEKPGMNSLIQDNIATKQEALEISNGWRDTSPRPLNLATVPWLCQLVTFFEKY